MFLTDAVGERSLHSHLLSFREPPLSEAQFPRIPYTRLSKKWLGGSLEGEFRALLWSRNSDLPCFIDSQIPNSSPTAACNDVAPGSLAPSDALDGVPIFLHRAS